VLSASSHGAAKAGRKLTVCESLAKPFFKEPDTGHAPACARAIMTAEATTIANVLLPQRDAHLPGGGMKWRR